MMLGYKFRIYPSQEVQERLNKHLELCKWLYNRLLSELNKAKAEGRRLTQIDTQALIVKLKREENPELNQVYSKVLQMVNRQLWSNIYELAKRKKQGKKVGKLRYKTGNSMKTLNYNQRGFKIDSEHGKLILSKIGSIPIKLHRPVDGEVKGVIIKRASSGRWYAIIQLKDKPKPLPPTGRVVGIDVGIRYFLTDSDGIRVENPKFYDRTMRRLQILQRKLCRKVQGSKNWEKTRLQLAKTHERLVNQRNDFLHKLSRYYVNNYDIIVVEDLHLDPLLRQGGTLSRHIHDASWSKFIALLSYKAASAGRRVVRVNPRGTSRGLSWNDPYRDYIAACRIKYRGLGQPCPPVESRPLLRTISVAEVVSGQVYSMKQEA